MEDRHNRLSFTTGEQRGERLILTTLPVQWKDLRLLRTRSPRLSDKNLRDPAGAVRQAPIGMM